MTTAEMLINEGVLKGRLATLRQLLELKFGSLPAAVIDRLGAADEPTLNGMLQRILSATSVEQVLGS